MNKRTVIVSGGSLDQELTLSILRDSHTAHVIGVDKGLAFLYQHQILPDVIVGDFDSLSEGILAFYKETTDIPVREFHPVKDATDTEIAIRLAIENGWDNLVILGATGTRMDHVWGNVQTLKAALDAGVEACIMDAHNRIRLVRKGISMKKEDAYGNYFSVFPLEGSVEDLCIQGAKYPLTNHRLLPYDSLCVSNQFDSEQVEITFSKGILIFMETKD